jgi:hypothetical protein
MELMVGCPVKDRAWIMPSWMQHLEVAVIEAGLRPSDVQLLFIGDSGNDLETVRAIDEGCLRYGFSRILAHVHDPGSYERHWEAERLHRMVELRNRMLSFVRVNEPTMFWSLDSDILVHPRTLIGAIEGLDRYDAVGTKCYMTEQGVGAPSNGTLGAAGLRRLHAHALIEVEVIMASKLMGPAAYAVDYVFDRLGEDIGWSKRARELGLRLGWDGRVCSRHVMRPALLQEADPRC